MARSSERAGRAASALGVAWLAAAPSASSTSDALAIARLSLVEHKVELGAKGAPWRPAVEGGSLKLGEALRTGPEAVARIELSWMSLTLSPASTLRFPDALLLQATLESGRALVDAPAQEALKLVTDEAEVRGRGRAVVRRQDKTTLVTCLTGSFKVVAGRSLVTLAPGQGTVALAGQPPSAPQRAPAPPQQGRWPASDPVYVTPGEAIEVRWKGTSPGYQVEVLPVGADVVLIQRDVTQPLARIAIPWEGAFRWRVSARDARGLEGLPSADGLIAVDSR
jgi:hypothetical protein